MILWKNRVHVPKGVKRIFAWKPVWTINGRLVWLEFVYVNEFVGDGGKLKHTYEDMRD